MALNRASDTSVSRPAGTLRRSRRWLALLAVLITVGLIGAGTLTWANRPRHYSTHVTPDTTPADILQQYIEATNQHACTDADALMAPGAQYSLCEPWWKGTTIRSYHITHDWPGLDIHDYGGGSPLDDFDRWPQRRILEVDLDIDRRGPFAEAPSGHNTKKFGFGRNTDTKPWKITELGFF